MNERRAAVTFLVSLISFTESFQINRPFSFASKARAHSSGQHLQHLNEITISRTSLRATDDEDDGEWEYEYDYEGDDGEYEYAESEPFESEASVAVAANEMAAAGAGAGVQSVDQNSGAIELRNEVQSSFLQYAMSIILGRALPDIRDGLKPVHRRILYSMHQLQLAPSSPHRKCARVVGEVLGKYHPHGDMAVYDALVRMAQDFTTNCRLVDGHGNFGSVDADPAAAMRYTECRLTKLATACLLEELGDNTVDFSTNFDGNEVEPNVLPAKVPILLLNGSSGIAVGMATNIPPHNLKEIMSACIAFVETRIDPEKEVTDADLFEIVPGPDFPTGASIMGTSGAQQLYKTGNGGIKMRAITRMEQTTSGRSRNSIVVTELPYQVNKATLLEKIAGLVNEKKLEGIADLRDESDRDGIRVVLELKNTAVPNVVLNNLYKKTSLQTSFSGNFLALMEKEMNDGSSAKSLTPQRFTLRQALDQFLDFRFATIRRKTAHTLSKVTARAHIVLGLLMALEKVDEVIKIVRSAPDQSGARDALMDENGILGLSREQADAVLRLQLGQLTRLNKDKLENERDDLKQQEVDLTRLIQVDEAVYELMIEEFQELSDKFGVGRQTRILNDDGEVDEIDMIKNSRSVVVVTRGGYIKRMPLKVFDSQKRGTRGKRGTSKSGDVSPDEEVSHCFTCNDHDTLIMVTQSGIAFGIRAYQIGSTSRIAKGQPIPSVLPIRADDTITTILPVSEFSESEYVVLATEQGWIKRTALKAFEKISSRGLIIATLNDGDRLKWCRRCSETDDLLICSRFGQATRFEVAGLRPTGRTSRGVRSMKLRENDSVADMNVLRGKEDSADQSVLCMTAQGYGKRMSTSEFRVQARGGIGVIAIKFKKKAGGDHISCFCVVDEDDEVLVNTSKGIMVRTKVSNISKQSRTATGVVVQKVDEGDQIMSVSLVPQYESESESE